MRVWIPLGGMDVSVVCCQGEVCFGLNHSSRGDLPTVLYVCVCVCDREASTMRRSWTTMGCRAKEKNVIWETNVTYKCWERCSVQIPRSQIPFHLSVSESFVIDDQAASVILNCNTFLPSTYVVQFNVFLFPKFMKSMSMLSVYMHLPIWTSSSHYSKNVT
jgi:hypothetical protein